MYVLRTLNPRTIISLTPSTASAPITQSAISLNSFKYDVDGPPPVASFITTRSAAQLVPPL